MAEAMELDLSLNKSKNNPVENPVPITPIAPKNGGQKEVNSRYTTENYYQNDSLGSDVLKQKYLSPWESHPHEMWRRQSIALASVEKTKKFAQ